VRGNRATTMTEITTNKLHKRGCWIIGVGNMSRKEWAMVPLTTPIITTIFRTVITKFIISKMNETSSISNGTNTVKKSDFTKESKSTWEVILGTWKYKMSLVNLRTCIDNLRTCIDKVRIF